MVFLKSGTISWAVSMDFVMVNMAIMVNMVKLKKEDHEVHVSFVCCLCDVEAYELVRDNTSSFSWKRAMAAKLACS